MEHELGHSDFGIDYSNLISSPKTPKSSMRRQIKTPKTPSARGDRFIPNRSAMDMDISHFNLLKENTNPNSENPLLGTPSKDEYKERLAESLFQSSATNLGSTAKVINTLFICQNWQKFSF